MQNTNHADMQWIKKDLDREHALGWFHKIERSNNRNENCKSMTEKERIPIKIIHINKRRKPTKN